MPGYFPPPSTGGGGGGGTGDMLSTNNLSDVSNAGTSRTNLGLGTAATKASGDFLQVANNLSDITASTARTNLGLGTAAVQNVGVFAQVANNLSDVTASTARTNLGLTSLATASVSGGPGITASVAANVLTVSSLNPFLSGDGKPYNLAISNQYYTVITSGNYALSLTGGTTGQAFRIKIIQDGTGNRTVSWWSGISWPGGTVPTLSSGIGKADWFTFIQTGASTYDGAQAMINL